MLTKLIGLVEGLLNVYKLAIMAYVVLGWLRIPANRWTEWLRAIVEPLLNPLRTLLYRLIPRKWMFFDYSPLALYLLVGVVQWLL